MNYNLPENNSTVPPKTDLTKFMTALKPLLSDHGITVLCDMDAPTAINVVNGERRVLVAKSMIFEIDWSKIYDSAAIVAKKIKSMGAIAVAFYELNVVNAIDPETMKPFFHNVIRFAAI